MTDNEGDDTAEYAEHYLSLYMDWSCCIVGSHEDCTKEKSTGEDFIQCNHWRHGSYQEEDEYSKDICKRHIPLDNLPDAEVDPAETCRTTLS